VTGEVESDLMRGRKQNIDTLSDQSAQRVEPEVMIGM